MATSIDVEEAIFGSQHIRNFLAHFTQQQWSRLVKATLLVGISRVNQLAQRSGTELSRLTVDSIEDLAVHTHKNVKPKRPKTVITTKIGAHKGSSYRANPYYESNSNQKTDTQVTENLAQSDTKGQSLT